MTRGDVYQVRLHDGRGHEQRGARYGVVLQADELMVLSTVLVAPTSASALPAPFRPEIKIGGKTNRVMLEQLRAIDVRRLGRRAGRLSAPERRVVDEALEFVLGLV